MKLKSLVSCSLVALRRRSRRRRRRRSRSSGGTPWAAPSANGSTTWPRASTRARRNTRSSPTFKGSYPETLTAGIAAFRAGNAPDILQVFEVGTATMMASKGAIVPVGKVMKDSGLKFDPARLRARGRRLLHGAERPDAELAVQQLDDDLLLQQGRLQGRRPRPEQGAGDLARGRARRGQAEGERPRSARSRRAGSAGPSSRASRPGTTSSSRPSRTAWAASTRGSPSTARCTCATSRTSRTWPSRACSSTRAATTRPTRPSRRASAP